MKSMKKLLAMLAAVVGMSMGNAAHAGIPVIDATSLVQQVQQVASWVKQYKQMTDQFTQMKQQYDSLNGARGMASLVNNPALRKYLPDDYQTILDSGYGNSAAIRASAKVLGVDETYMGAATDAAKAFNSNATQAALNRATTEAGYKQASDRFATIQVLLDKVSAAPDAKDIADLQARIQAEQVMMQNESVKLNMMGQLAQAQRDLAAQRSIEMRMKASKITVDQRF
ncbi:P-type DNA transfer protein VirB5 [Sulfuriferula sp.]|uniref:P-type DNA transfer protein VirB5 n=1 Tax=Sulfuriferula sp. TaxID=2025307 RepID=UPI00272EF3BD|nr:P-type DNA transfer protein VirB5 [Sulfuriferula sp.]MDP2027519.1 P-type DNA transfer protein VirB5 [Sulfuriferula sp.]